MVTSKDNLLQRIFKFKEKNTNIKNELYSGLLLFLSVFFVIKFVSDILQGSYTPAESMIIFPMLFLAIGITSGLLTIISGFITNLPFAIVPNIIFSIMIAVTGSVFLGYSLKLVLISAFIASLAFVLTSFLLKKDKILDLIPEFLKNSFMLIFGLVLILSGLIYSNILIKTPMPEPATTISGGAPTISFIYPASISSILSPIPLLTILGLCLFVYLNIKYKKNAFLLTFVIITIIGFFIPLSWSKYRYSMKLSTLISLPIRKEGFQLLFSNITLPFKLNLPAFKQFFVVLKSSYSLLLLSFSFYITLLFFNLHSIFSILNIGLEEKETFSKETFNKKTYTKLTRFSSISSLVGILTNTTFYTYAQESVFSFYNKGKSGLTAIFCGLLVLLYTCFAPIRYLSSPSAISILIIGIGILVIEKAFKKISFNSLEELIPLMFMILVSCITMNPVEGLLVGFSVYSLIEIFKIIAGKKSQLNWFMFISLLISIIYFKIKFS